MDIIFFNFHGKKPWYRVQVFNIPIGVSIDEIEDAFEEYGEIQSIESRFKQYHGLRMNTGQRTITFSQIIKNIPSYVTVRGWKAYVYYSGQQKTCRNCGETNHLAKGCPRNRRPEDTPMGQQCAAEEPNEEVDGKPTDMDVQESSTPNVPAPKDLIRPSTCQEILENLEPFENVALANVTLEDCQVPTSVEEEAQQNAANPKKQSQAWADSTDEVEEFSVVGSKKPQEVYKQNKQKTEITIQVRPKTYCPVCRVDSHSEEQCGRVAVYKHPIRENLADGTVSQVRENR